MGRVKGVKTGTQTIRRFSPIMKFKHFSIIILFRDDQYFGGWRVCETQSLDHCTYSEAGLPLGKRLSKKKLEDFALECIAQADACLLKGEAYEAWKGVKIGKPLVEVFNPDFKVEIKDE